MMRTLLLALAAASPFATLAIQHTDEPPLLLTLDVDGQSFDVTMAEPAHIRIGDRDVTVTVSAKPVRHFTAGNLAFDFPSTLRYAHDDSRSDVESWNLAAEDVTVTVLRFSSNDLNAVLGRAIEGSAAQLGDTAEAQWTTLELGGLPRPARRLTATVDDQNVAATFVGLADGDRSIVLALTEFPAEAGGATAQGDRVRELLASTFRLRRSAGQRSMPRTGPAPR